VINDSGLDKKSYFFGKYCITLREQTEWVELVENGYNVLVGSNKFKLKEAFELFQTNKNDFSLNLYGKGQAAERAVREIIKL